MVQKELQSQVALYSRRGGDVPTVEEVDTEEDGNTIRQRQRTLGYIYAIQISKEAIQSIVSCQSTASMQSKVTVQSCIFIRTTNLPLQSSVVECKLQQYSQSNIKIN